nr:MAG TPA: hypothetical protein [Caudoviricetes sp.]
MLGLFLFGIINIHHRQRATRLSHSSFFVFKRGGK